MISYHNLRYLKFLYLKWHRSYRYDGLASYANYDNLVNKKSNAEMFRRANNDII